MAFDVREYTKKKRQGLTMQVTEEKSSGGFDVREYTKQKRAQSAVQELGNRVNAWVESANSFVNDYNSRFSSREEGKYVADSQRWLAQSTSRKTALDAEAQSIRDMIGKYSDYLDNGWVSNVGGILQSGSGDIDKLLQYSQQDADFWAQFDPTQEQAAQGITADSLYGQWYTDNSYRQKYAGQSYSQLLLTLAQMEDGEERNWLENYTPTVMTTQDMEGEIQSNEEKLAALQDTLSQANALVDSIGMGGAPDGLIHEELKALLKNAGFKNTTELNNAIEALRADSWHLEQRMKYDMLPQNADYAQQSQKVADAPTAGFGVGIGTSWWGQGDPVYDYINDIDGTQMKTNASSAFKGSPYSIYSNMKDAEVANYNYLYNTKGKKAADEYLDYLEYALSERQMAVAAGNAKLLADKAPVLASAISVPTNLMSGIGALDIMGQNAIKGIKEAVTGEYAGPINYNSNAMLPTAATTSIRGTVAQNIADSTGRIQLDSQKHPVLSKMLNGKSLGDVYQLGMSMADSGAVALMTPFIGSAGTALLGGSAASRGILDAVEAGASDFQALSMGLLNGGFEMLFEKVSLENLLNGNTRNIVRKIITQGLVEGSEEFNTSLANTLADTIIMADKSQLKRSIAAYIESGFTEQEATRKALTDIAVQMGWDFVGGVISGGIMGGIAAPIQNYQYAAEEGNRIYGSDPQGLIDEVLDIDAENALAGKMRNRLEHGKGVSGKQLYDLAQQKEAALRKQDITTIQNAAKARLVELGETEAVDAVAAALAKESAGQQLTKAERQAISKSKYGQRVSNELNAENIDSGDYSSGWTESIGTQRINAKEYSSSKGLQQVALETDGGKTVTAPMAAEKTARQQDVDTVKKQAVAATTAVPENANRGKAHLVTDPDKAVTVKEIAEMKNGSAKLLLDDGTVVDAADVEFDNEGEALLYDIVAQMGIPRVSTANVLADGIHLSKAQNMEDYAAGIEEAFRFGQQNIPKQELRTSTYASLLDPSRQDFAYRQGQKMVGKQIARKQAAVQKARKNAPSAKDAKSGKVQFMQGKQTEDLRSYISKSGKALSAVQETAISTMEKLSAVLGVDFYVYESYEKSGKRLYVDENGNEKPAPSGKYAYNGRIYIDLNAGNTGKGTMLYTVAHELAHFIKQWSPAKFKALANFLVSQYGEQGVSVDELVRKQMSKAEAQGISLTYEEAFEEMVADSMGTMLIDGTVVQMMADLKQQDKTLWQKICDWFKNLVADLKAVTDAYSGYKPDSAEGRMVADMQDVIVSLERLYGDALLDAGENYKAAGAQKNTTREGDVKMQTRSVNGDGVVWIENSGFTNAQLKDPNAIAQYIAAHIGEVYKIIESGQKVYIGKDLPGEYTHSKYTSYLQKKNPSALKAKNKAASALGEMIEIATNRRWEATKHKQSKDAKYGMYRYDTKFAFPVKDQRGNVTTVKAYDAELLIRNASDGKKYLYDIVNIKEDTANALDLRHKEARKGNYQAATQNDVSKNSIRNPEADVKEKFSLREDMRTAAIEHFGRTFSWKETGYLLTNGAKLDFSGRHEGASGGYRTVDHRDILDIYSEDTDLDGNGAMVDFMRQGNIRIMPEGDGINLQVQPTKAQEQALSDFISRARGEVTLDIDDENGNTVVSMEYPRGTHSSKVLQDIRNYFETGKKPSMSPVAQFHYSLRDPSAEAVDKALRQENEKLKEDVQRLRDLLKLQRQVTGGTKFTKSSVEAAARYLKQAAGAKGDTKELSQILNSFYEFVATAKDLTWEDVKEQAKSAAQWLQKHVVLESGRGEYAGEVLRTIRTSRISLDDSQKAEAAYRYGSFNDFRKATMGTVIVAKDGVPLDIQWQEWADMYPDIFDAGTTATDMPFALMEVAQSLRNADLSKAEYAYHADMIEQDLIRQVYDSYWRVSTLRTVADSMQKQINVLKSKHYSQMDKLRQTHREKTEQLKQEYRQRVVDMRSRMTETAEKRTARGKLQKLVLDTVKWITHPTKTDVRCPDFLKKPYSDFLNSIDLSSQRLGKGGDPTKADLRLANAMNQLATALGKVMEAQDPGKTNVEDIDSGYLDLPVNFVAEMQSMAQKVTDMMVEGEYVVNTMPATDVRKLSQMIRTLNHAIKEVSRLYANMRFANVEALGTDSMEYMAALGTAQESGGIKDFVTWDNALPFYAFKRFGKGGESVFEGLMDGQDKLAQLAKEIFDFQKKTWTEKEAKAWSEDTHIIELSDGELTLTTADAMSIYCTARRDKDHGLRHLLGGGVRVMGLQKGSKKAQDSHALLTVEDISTISDSLTARQKEVAEALQEFMSTVCAEWGNEISMKRFLTKDFTESRYFPIESNDENMTVKDPAAQQSDLFRLLNISATKPLTPKANNEVIIRNIFDVFTNHTADMARLNAFGMALLDYMKWFNYRQKTVKENGQIDVKGVRKSMEMAYGKTAGSYVMNLIKDVNGRPSDGGLPQFYARMLRNAKTAMVGNSARVAALQVTSYPRAALVLSPKNLALGLSKKPNIERAKKYCGIALWKSYGFYDTNISRSLEEQIKGKTNLQQKMIEWSLKGAELGDALTWGCLWNACEYEVAATKQHDIGTEAFYQAVGRKLREVVYSTQVVDSVLTRSQMMRSKNAKTKEISSFMSEPTLSANILMDAGMQFQAEKRRSGSAKAAWQKTGKLVGRAIAVYGIGQISAALVESLFDAWRDDEDDKFRNKYLKALGQNLILDLLPFNKIPIISEFAEALLSMAGVGYFSTDSLYSTAVSQAVSALNTWKSVLNGSSSATVYNGIYKTTRALSSFGGVAIGGAMREAVALWNNTAGAYDPTWKILQTKCSKTELGELLYVAIVEENDRWIKSVRGEFADSSESTKYLKTAVKEHFAAGELDVDTAVQFLKKHCDMSDSEARASVAYWDHKRENPDSEVSSAWFDSYYKKVAGSGISIDTYLAYRNKAKDMDTKEQKLRVIHSLQLTKAQKDALYRAEGWAESGLADAPWN